MRKNLILILLIFALCTCGISYLHGTVNSVKDAVELSETTFIGDISAAEALSVNLRANCHNHLFWDTTVLPGQMPTTEFAFSQSEVKEDRTQYYSGVQIYLNTKMGASSTGNIELNRYDMYGLAEIFRDVASRTENGSTHTEKVYIKHYYDFYPLSIDLNLPDNRYLSMDIFSESKKSAEDDAHTENPASILKKIADYFKFPVLEQHQLEVTITKDDEGNIVELNSSNVQGCDVWIYAENAITDDYCYFALSANTQEEVLMDYSNVPGGYGIYRLPCATQEEPMTTIDELKMVYPLETNEKLRLFQTSADQTKLLLVTQEENYYILKVLDPKTAQELQRIPLMEYKEDIYASELYVGEDFLVALFGETQFVVLSQTGGSYKLSFTGTLPEKEIFSFNYSYDYVMAFDGEKLAMAAINDRNTYNTLCGFSLVVCDKTGTLYAGRYDSSLDKAQAAEYIDRCKAMDNAPLKIQWE